MQSARRTTTRQAILAFTLCLSAMPAAADLADSLLRTDPCDCTLEESGLSGPVRSVVLRREREPQASGSVLGPNSTSYSPDGKVTERRFMDREGATLQLLVFNYEDEGRRIRIESTGARPASINTRILLFDASGNMTSNEERQSDLMSRSEWIFSAEGQLRAYRYRSAGRISNDLREEYGYDPEGRLISVVHSCGPERSAMSSCRFEETRLEYPAPNTTRKLELSTCRLDGEDTGDPTIITEEVLDDDGRVRSESIATTEAFNPSPTYCMSVRPGRTEYEYNADGTVSTRRFFDASGRLVEEGTTEYDSRGKPLSGQTRRWSEDGTESVQPARPTKVYEYDDFGNVVRESSESYRPNGEVSLREITYRDITYY